MAAATAPPKLLLALSSGLFLIANGFGAVFGGPYKDYLTGLLEPMLTLEAYAFIFALAAFDKAVFMPSILF